MRAHLSLHFDLHKAVPIYLIHVHAHQSTNFHLHESVHNQLHKSVTSPEVSIQTNRHFNMSMHVCICRTVRLSVTLPVHVPLTANDCAGARHFASSCTRTYAPIFLHICLSLCVCMYVLIDPVHTYISMHIRIDLSMHVHDKMSTL